MTGQGDSRPGRMVPAALALLTLAGLALRVWRLDVPGLWWDEMVTLLRSALPVADIWSALRFQAPSDAQVDLFPPLHHILLRLLAGPAPTPAQAKLLSALSGTLAIPALYLLGRVTLGWRAGLLGAAAMACNLFQIHYAREVRPYSLFVLLSCLSMAFFMAGLQGGRARVWAAHAVASILLCYTSYMAASCLMAQALLAAGWGVARFARGGAARREALAATARFALSGVAVGLAYLPWLEAHLFNYALIQDPLAVKHLDGAILLRFVEILFAHEYYGGLALAPAVLLLAGLGAAAALRRGRGAGLALLALWALLPVAMVFTVKTRMDIQPRYFLSLQMALMLAAGAGADWLGGLAPARAAGLARAGATCLGLAVLCLPMALSYPRYVRKESSGYRQAALQLAENGWDVRGLAFQDPSQRAVLRPLLGRDFDFLDRFSGDSPRVWYVSHADARPLDGAVLQGRTGNLETPSAFWKLRLVNRAPLWLPPGGYRARFDGLGVYADCLRLDNVAPKPALARLGLLDPQKPGELVYQFQTPPGAPLGLELGLAAEPHFAGWPDAQVLVDVETPDNRWRELARFGAEAFLARGAPAVPGKGGGPLRLEAGLEIPPDATGPGMARLRLRLEPGTRDGLIEVDGLRVSCRGQGPWTGDSPALRSFDQVAGRTPVLPWREDAPLFGSTALHAFALDPALEGLRPALGGAAQHARFRALHPGLAPSLLLAHEDERPGIALYDPGLTDSGRIPPGAGQTLRSLDEAPLEPAGVGLWGPLDRPVLRVDGAEATVPVSAPEGTALFLNPGGEGRLVFQAVPGEGGWAEHSGAGLAPAPEAPGLSCDSPLPCFVVWRFESGLPITWLHLVYETALVRDDGRTNAVRAAYSTDGAVFHPLDEVRSPGLFPMHGRAVRTGRARLEKPAAKLYLRLELSGDGARVLSPPDRPLRLEMGLDCKALRLPAIPDKVFPLGVSGQGCPPSRLVFSRLPWRFFDSLKRPD